MSDIGTKAPAPLLGANRPPRFYNRDALTYSNTFDNPFQRNLIKTVEWLTGKLQVVRMVREFEKRGKLTGQAFWSGALEVMGIDLLTPQDQIDLIPRDGPVIVVANHPHGLVDGMILAELLGRARPDYRILTRAFLADIDEGAGKYMIPVPFPHAADAQRQMIEMRRQSMAHLKDGGLIALFPSGVVGASRTLLGPMVEDPWNVFTAKMIRTSGARVVPLYFPGANTRWYQMANRLSATMRQSLLIHEIVKACNRPHKPVIGAPFDAADLAERLKDPRACMAWMREQTLGLRETV